MTTRRAFLGSLAIAAAAPAAVTGALAAPPAPPCIVTFGCTTESQAKRLARWMLYTDPAYARTARASAMWTDPRDGSFHVSPPVSRS